MADWLIRYSVWILESYERPNDVQAIRVYEEGNGGMEEKSRIQTLRRGTDVIETI